MKKCIVFCRVSTNHQELENQRNKVISIAKADGYSMDEIAIVEGKESAIKLKEEERETINEMKSLIEQFPTIESVYVFAIDRLARRVSVILSVKDYLTEKGINLVFLNPHKMSTLRINEKGEKVEDELTSLLLMLLSYGADMEMKVKKERFKTVKDAMRKNGQITESVAITGYKKGADKKPIVDEEVAPYIIKTFQRYANENVSLATLASELASLGITKSTTQSRVRSILTNLSYSGRGGVKYPPIIDAETQDKCIEKLKLNKNNTKTASKNIYYGRGLVKGEDGNTLAVSTRNCSYGNGRVRNSININVADTVAWLEACQIYKVMLSDDSIERTRNYQATIQENEKKVAHCQKMVEEGELKKSKAFKMYIAGKVGEIDYTSTINEIEKNIAKWEKEIARLNSETSLIQQKLETEHLNSFSVDYIDGITDDIQRRQIVESTIKAVYVKKNEAGNYVLEVEAKPEYQRGYEFLSKSVYEYIFLNAHHQYLSQKCVAYESKNEGKVTKVEIIKRFSQKSKKRA